MNQKTRFIIGLAIIIMYAVSLVLFFFRQPGPGSVFLALSTLAGIAFYLYGEQEKRRAREEEAREKAEEEQNK